MSRAAPCGIYMDDVNRAVIRTSAYLIHPAFACSMAHLYFRCHYNRILRRICRAPVVQSSCIQAYMEQASSCRLPLEDRAALWIATKPSSEHKIICLSKGQHIHIPSGHWKRAVLSCKGHCKSNVWLVILCNVLLCTGSCGACSCRELRSGSTCKYLWNALSARQNRLGADISHHRWL